MKEVIDRIIEEFDFEKVHRVMQILNWRWGRLSAVPSVGALVLCAQGLLQKTFEMDVCDSVATGGFKATKTENKDKGEGLELEFILISTEFCTKWLEEERNESKQY